LTGVLGEGGAQGRGLDLCLELGDLTLVAFGLSVHGVLETLEHLLEVRDAAFEGSDPLRLVVGQAGEWITVAGTPADLTDPRDESVAFGHRPRRPGRLG
jgi:hypothetical protein